MQKKWERSNKHTFFFYTRVQLRTFCVCSCVVQLPLCYLKDMGKRGMKKITQQVASNSLFWDGDGGRGGVTSGEEKSSKEFFLGTIAVGDDSLLKNKMESLLILLIYVGDSAEIVSPPLAVLPPDHILCGHPTTNGGMPNGSSVEIRMYVRTHCIHVSCTFGTNLYAQSMLINKISASELSQKFIKSALLVGQAAPNLPHRDTIWKSYCLG